MDGDPPFKVVCDTCIKRTVAAADDIAVIRSVLFRFFRNSSVRILSPHQQPVKRKTQIADKIVHKIYAQIRQNEEAKHQDLCSL